MLDAEHRWLHDRNTVVRSAADVPVYVSLRREGFAVRLSDCRRTIEALNRLAWREKALHDWLACLWKNGPEQ